MYICTQPVSGCWVYRNSSRCLVLPSVQVTLPRNSSWKQVLPISVTRASLAFSFLRFEQLASNMTTRSILLKIISLIMILQASAVVFGRPVPRLQRRIESLSPARASTSSGMMPRTNEEGTPYQGGTGADTSRSHFRRVIVESEENVPADQCCTKCEAYLQSHNLDMADQLKACVSLCQNDGIVGSIPKPTPRIGVTILNKAQRSLDRS
ncbi:hypothetical protein F5879DRAFT_365670 [Lentinula edodes]|nr:hypothetical protein F5879DRAFT_365670 [Lentinula edodes]